MGLLNPVEWIARWISDGKPTLQRDEDYYKDDPAPLFRKAFTVGKSIRRARLYISGLGYYEAFLNGRRVGDRQLDPLWTTYSRRVFYSTYDVTDLLHPGGNAMGVTLGNGWYNPLPMKMWGWLNLREWLTVGRPCLLARLAIEFDDGSTAAIVTDSTWKAAEGPILRNNIYLGEVYDARREKPGWNESRFDDSAWKPAVVVEGPAGVLRAQPVPPIRICETLPARQISEPAPNIFTFDFGRNFAGLVRLRVAGPAGTKIVLRYGELLYPGGMLNPMTSVAGQIKQPGMAGPGAPDLACASDTYILRGKGEEVYTPRFTFHGFRYLEVSGWPGRPTLDAVKGLVMRCDLEPAGEFECSNELFNRIQQMCVRTFQSNLFGVQSDCPTRERFGWGGDIAVVADALLLNFDMAAFYAKTVNDYADAADEDGWLTETAPFVGVATHGFGKKDGDKATAGFAGRSGPIGWTIVHPLLLRDLYRYYGDSRLIEEQYETVRRWLELVRSQAHGGLLTDCWGDHESLDPKPIAALATAHYHQATELLAGLADLLGRKEDTRRYSELAAEIKEAFATQFLTEHTGRVASGTQAAQALGLYHGLVSGDQRAAALTALVETIKARQYHLSTGIFGTKYLLDVISREGFADTGMRIVDSEQFPGWGHMLRAGATTVWETWKFSGNVYSHNHPMFGSVSEWFFRHVAGLAPADDAVGFDRIIIRPNPSDRLTWARARYHSIRGLVESNWRVNSGRLTMAVEVPPGATALVYVPATEPATLTESGGPVSRAKGVKLLRIDGQEAVLEVRSGRYVFESGARHPENAPK